MKTVRLTEKEKQFIQDNYLRYSQRNLSKIIGRSKFAVQYFMQKNQLSVSKETVSQRRSEAQQKKTTSTLQEDRYLKENYLTFSVKTIAAHLGRGNTFVSNRLRQLGLIIPRKIIEARKVKSQFKPGQEPYSKGKKQSEYLTPEQIENSKKTWFKKGNIPANAFDRDGVITTRVVKGKPYKFIRISLGNWRHLHVYNWEKENGPVPPDKICAFIDGNQQNCEPSNLKLITREENMLRNSKKNYTEKIVKDRSKILHLKKIIKQIEKQNL